MFRVLGPDLIIENALKNLEKWPKNQKNIYLIKEWCSLSLCSFMALFRVQIIHQTIQNNNRKEEKWPKSQK